MQHSFGRLFSLAAVCAAVLMLVLAAGSCKRGEQAKPAPAKPAAQGADAAQKAKPAEPGILMRAVVDNDRVRVLEALWEPKATAPAITQEGKETIGVVGVVLRGGTLEYTAANGKKTRHERKIGDVFWQPGNSQLEARVNVGQTALDVVQVRVKKGPPPTGQYQGPVDRAKPVMNNERVAVFDYTVAPGASLPMHKYGPRIWVILEGGQMRSTDTAGKATFGNFAPGQVVPLPPADQALENMGKTPVRVVSVELK